MASAPITHPAYGRGGGRSGTQIVVENVTEEVVSTDTNIAYIDMTGSPAVLTTTSKVGISSGGVPYLDDNSASPGEEAHLVIDSSDNVFLEKP